MNLTRKPAGRRTVAVGLLSAVAIALAVYVADTPRTAAGHALILLLAAMVAGAATLTPWRQPPVSQQDRTAALEELDSAHVTRSKALHKALRRAARLWVAVSLVPALLLALTPVGPALIRSLGDSRTTQLILGILVAAGSGSGRGCDRHPLLWGSIADLVGGLRP